MKYYDNLRLVIEIQSRLKEWTDQDPSQNGSSARQRGRVKEVVSNELRKSSRGAGRRLLPGVRKGAV